MKRELAIETSLARVVLGFSLANLVSLAAPAVSPSVAKASTSPVEELISQCPRAAK
jgi:hypothetical protein